MDTYTRRQKGRELIENLLRGKYGKDIVIAWDHSKLQDSHSVSIEIKGKVHIVNNIGYDDPSYLFSDHSNKEKEDILKEILEKIDSVIKS